MHEDEMLKTFQSQFVPLLDVLWRQVEDSPFVRQALLDMLASRALPSLIEPYSDADETFIAEAAYDIAEAMMAERDRRRAGAALVESREPAGA